MSMCKVICVTNRKLAGEHFLSQIEAVVQAGVKAVILREKDLSEAEYEHLAAEVCQLCEAAGVPLILHTHAAAARRLGIKRLHLPYAEFVSMTKEEIEEFEAIGVSVHSIEEAVKASQMGAAYLIAGHIYETDCKKGLKPRGIVYLQELCEAVRIPVYAIGGITHKNVSACKGAGAAGVCMMSSLMKAKFPKIFLKTLSFDEKEL